MVGSLVEGLGLTRSSWLCEKTHSFVYRLSLFIGSRTKQMDTEGINTDGCGPREDTAYCEPDLACDNQPICQSQHQCHLMRIMRLMNSTQASCMSYGVSRLTMALSYM